MSDKELIRALRWCAAGHDGGCIDCPAEEACDECSGKALVDAADRLEALLAENELLYREVAKLNAECDHFRDLTKKLWCEKEYGEDINVPTKRISKYAGLEGMTAAQWNAHGPQPIYCGDLPCVMFDDDEPPRTEEMP